jgi:hypothetical protein
MKFAFYENLTEAAQLLVGQVFVGGVNSVADTGLRLAVTRHGRTVTLNDGYTMTVVVHIPCEVRAGIAYKKEKT